MEHVAKRVNKHPIMVKELNLYEKHQVGGFRMGLELLALLTGWLLDFVVDWILAVSCGNFGVGMEVGCWHSPDCLCCIWLSATGSSADLLYHEGCCYGSLIVCVVFV